MYDISSNISMSMRAHYVLVKMEQVVDDSTKQQWIQYASLSYSLAHSFPLRSYNPLIVFLLNREQNTLKTKLVLHDNLEWTMEGLPSSSSSTPLR